MPRKKKAPKKEPTQETETGYEIPVPKRKDVFGLLDRAARKNRKERAKDKK